MQCNRCTPASSWLPGPGLGTAIKAYRVAPQIRSVFPCAVQEKSPTMKFVIVLFAVMAVASAFPGIPWAAPVAQPWPSQPWPNPWVAAPAPSYVKVAQPAYVKVAVPQVHAPEVHHAIQIPQQQSIPNPHPQPLHIKVAQPHISRVAAHAPHIVPPHLIAVEQYVEPIAKPVIVKTPVHHPWD